VSAEGGYAASWGNESLYLWATFPLRAVNNLLYFTYYPNMNMNKSKEFSNVRSLLMAVNVKNVGKIVIYLQGSVVTQTVLGGPA